MMITMRLGVTFPGKTYADKRMLEAHDNWHNNVFPYRCEQCDFKSHGSRSLVQHIALSHQPKLPTQKCGKCGQLQTAKHDELYHDPNHPFWCQEPGCDFRGATQDVIESHHKRMHEKKGKVSTASLSPEYILHIVLFDILNAFFLDTWSD